MIVGVSAPLNPAPITVWIAEGCTRCHWCQHLLPTVFVDTPEGSRVRSEARRDGGTCTNATARSPLKEGYLDADSAAFLTFVADGCPVRVINVER
jgi:ferredoxin